MTAPVPAGDRHVCSRWCAQHAAIGGPLDSAAPVPAGDGYGLSHDICLCSAKTGCPEGDENQCPVCRRLDPYDPCPRLGFCCGLTPGDLCDCCTDAQWKAASRG